MANYWQNKISVFLHDPPHKALKIPGHEERADQIALKLFQSPPEKETYQAPDMIASGMTRAALPGYSTKPEKNGAIDFLEAPVLTHPLVGGEHINLKLANAVNADDVQNEILALFEKDLGIHLEVEKLRDEHLNKHYNRQDHESWSKALFFYLFFALRKRLRAENIGKLGAAWDVFPADTRMPDHSIWQHCALASAIHSSMESDSNKQVALTVFSITPVQSFVAKSRKLRDSWTSSVILSYLAFCGIRTIMERLGPDHVMYPSLHDQSLVEAWLRDNYHLARYLGEGKVLDAHKKYSASIASFPNKFVFMSAVDDVESLCAEIRDEIQKEWERIARLVEIDYVDGEHARSLFKKEISDYWQYSWASSTLLVPVAEISENKDREQEEKESKNKELLNQVLAENKWSVESETIAAFSSVFDYDEELKKGTLTARMYMATHTLIQSLLASAKLKPVRVRNSQQGEKCPLCGEHEVLHNLANPGQYAAQEYKKGVDTFWDALRDKKNPDNMDFTQIGKNERLCGVCLIKRFLPVVMRKHKDELLHSVFSSEDSFPSTTELAAFDYLRQLEEAGLLDSNTRKKLVNELHGNEVDDKSADEFSGLESIRHAGRDKGIVLTDKHKYYAVLMMDGDKMGDLINGETISAAWKDVIHPELARRFEDKSFCKSSPFNLMSKRDGENEEVKLIDRTRLINPSLHANISEALNSFARYGVAPVFRNGGRLIYAGGDDVCAVMPLSMALDAAHTIQQAYNMNFVSYNDNGAVALNGTADTTTVSKIGIHPGSAPGISISAALIIAHHKQPLKEVLKEAHQVLDAVSKNKTGRNALTIRLKKRSGGDRDLSFKWNAYNPFRKDELLIDSFRNIMEAVAGTDLSSSLVYRMRNLEEAVRPILARTKDSLHEMDESCREKIIKLFQYEVAHSGLHLKDQTSQHPDRVMAERLAGLCITGVPAEDRPDWFNAEGVVIGNFLAKTGRQA